MRTYTHTHTHTHTFSPRSHVCYLSFFSSCCHPHSCEHPDCGMRFVCPSRLQAHQKTHARSYRCSLCTDISFSTWSELCAHNAGVHTTHRCATCGRAFQKEDHLLRHELAHTLTKPAFVCKIPGCGKSYTSTYNLHAHVRSVHQKLGFACPAPYCGRIFAHNVSVCTTGLP